MMFCAKRERWTENKIVSLLDGSLATILNNCNLPPKESTLKFLQRLRFDTYRFSEFSLITTLTNLNCWERLNELSSIDIRLAMIISDFPLLIGSKLLSNHDGEDWSASEHHLLKSVRGLAGVLGHRQISILMSKFENMSELEKFSRKLDKRVQHRKIHKYELVLHHAEYPIHRSKDNDHIKPIENTEQLSTFNILYRDSIQALILDDQYCAFKMSYPERALIGVELKGGSLPKLHQVRKNEFQEASMDAQEFARSWLQSSVRALEL
jgi:competence protein ComGF